MASIFVPKVNADAQSALRTMSFRSASLRSAGRCASRSCRPRCRHSDSGRSVGVQCRSRQIGQVIDSLRRDRRRLEAHAGVDHRRTAVARSRRVLPNATCTDRCGAAAEGCSRALPRIQANMVMIPPADTRRLSPNRITRRSEHDLIKASARSMSRLQVPWRCLYLTALENHLRSLFEIRLEDF